MNFPTDERSARVLLNLCPMLGPVRTLRLLDRFGSAVDALSAMTEWRGLEGLGVAALTAGPAVRALLTELPQELGALQRMGARTLISTDEEYPEAFRALADGPLVVYLWGRLEEDDERSVALVGSRRPTAYGRSATERLAREFTEAGIPVVSGLARGIDTVAHQAVLAGRGRTIAVLGSGLNCLYPPENRRLAGAIAERGAVITEFSMNAPPDAVHFPRRNRLIAAFSKATVVVEAQEKSGALITAGLAAELGREVFAVPGSIFSSLSRGPFRLLQDGAAPVRSAEDVLLSLPILRRSGQTATHRDSAVPPVGKERTDPWEERVLAALGVEPVTIDEVADRLGAPVSEIAGALLRLEIEGRAVGLPGKNYARTERALPR